MRRFISYKTILLLMLVLLPSCAPKEYEDIMIGEFPEKYKNYDVLPWEMLEDERFFAAYENILEDFPEDQYLDRYISELYVVASGNRFVTTRQGPFIFSVGCMPHACTVARVLVLYDPDRNRVWAYAYDLGVHGRYEVWLGKPNEHIKKLVDDLDIMIDRRI
ncbi:MAG: hypothetical protein RQ767_05205 [Thermovirgaceae bacterium]|nr:hypothetical protein [Thermovirgaceae bacterium]